MEKTYIIVDKKKTHKYVQKMFNTPVTTHKAIMNKFNGETIALAESNNGNWFVVYLAGETAQEFRSDERKARKTFDEWRN